MTCEYCRTLNLISLLDSESFTPSDEIKKKAIRYYCENPDCSGNICPCHGQKEQCTVMDSHKEEDCFLTIGKEIISLD